MIEIDTKIFHFRREYNLRQRQIQSQRQTPVQQIPTSLMHHSPGSQPNLSKLVDNQQIAAGLAHLPQTHYLPSHYRAISPTQAAAVLADDLAYHQHALHNAASHPYLNHHATSIGPRDMLHLSQHSLNNHPISLRQAQYNSSKQRLIQSQSSQQSDSPNAGQQTAATLLHHPDCAAVIRPMVSNNPTHFYSTHGSPIRHTPSHKQANLNKQLLDDDSVDLQQFGGRQQMSTMHNQPPLFGMSRPSNLINSSQDEECESEISNQQINGQMNRELEYNEENEVGEDEDELLDEDEPQTQQLVTQQQQQQQLMRNNRPQFRQLSSNSNNDSNESAVDQSPLTVHANMHTNVGLNDEEKKHLVPLTNRLQQQLINKNYGSKMMESNTNSLGQQTPTSQATGANLTNNLMPSQQILQRNFVENRQN